MPILLIKYSTIGILIIPIVTITFKYKTGFPNMLYVLIFPNILIGPIKFSIFSSAKILVRVYVGINLPINSGPNNIAILIESDRRLFREAVCMNNNEKYQSNNKVVVQKSVKSGLSCSAGLAMVISYTTWKSIPLDIFNGILSWIYVIYYWIKYT